MDESLVVRRETQVAAPPATVFAFLTDPQKILSWMGAEADTDAHPGGLYLVKDIAGRPGRTARGEFREVVPVHRLAYSFGWDDDANVPPGSSLVEIDLLERNGGTLVRMTHTGLPNAYECDGHAKGWAYYLGRLGVAAAGGNPGVDRRPGRPRLKRDGFGSNRHREEADRPTRRSRKSSGAPRSLDRFAWAWTTVVAMTMPIGSNCAPAPVRNARRKRGPSRARRDPRTPIRGRHPPLLGQTRTEARSR